MAAASKLGGYSLAQADRFAARWAEGQKNHGKERNTLSKVCGAHDKIPEKKANAIFDLLEKFAVTDSTDHSAAYGVISYHTAT